MGKYVEASLTSGENVLYETRHHWMIFFSLYALFTLWIGPLVSWFSDEFAVTNKRIVAKVGVVSRRTLEMNAEKVESVNVSQTVLGRILGYGTITVIGTGGTKQPLRFISRPLDFRKAFQEARA